MTLDPSIDNHGVSLHFFLYSLMYLEKIFVIFPNYLIYFKDFIYLFMRDRGESRFPAENQAGSLMRDLIPGPRHHDLSQRQMLNPLSHPGAQNMAHFHGNILV